MNLEYMSVQKAAKLWNISDRRVRVLCAEGKITGVVKEGRAYRIPVDALKPVDERTLRERIYLLSMRIYSNALMQKRRN